MVKKILVLLVIGLLSFFAGKSYMQMSYTHSNAVELKKEYFFSVVSSMSMLEFIKKDITLAERIHLSKVANFFDDESSMFPIFSKEEKAYKILRQRAENYQNKYCKEKCLIKKVTSESY